MKVNMHIAGLVPVPVMGVHRSELSIVPIRIAKPRRGGFPDAWYTGVVPSSHSC